MSSWLPGGNLHTTEDELTEAGFVCHPVEAGRIARRVWTNDEAGLIAHRYPDGMTFGYVLDGADKIDDDEALLDYLEGGFDEEQTDQAVWAPTNQDGVTS